VRPAPWYECYDLPPPPAAPAQSPRGGTRTQAPSSQTVNTNTEHTEGYINLPLRPDSGRHTSLFNTIVLRLQKVCSGAESLVLHI
jgi:hypothetical protein